MNSELSDKIVHYLESNDPGGAYDAMGMATSGWCSPELFARINHFLNSEFTSNDASYIAQEREEIRGELYSEITQLRKSSSETTRDATDEM